MALIAKVKKKREKAGYKLFGVTVEELFEFTEE